MLRIFLVSAFALLIILSMNTSCKKTEETPKTEDSVKVDKSSTGTKNSVQSDDVYNTSINMVVASSDVSTSKNLNSCVSVTYSPNDYTSYPKTITIDYGTSGCVIGAKTVSGKIIATLSNKIRSIGTTVSITYESFKIDTITVNGTISLTVDDYVASLTDPTITLSSSTSNGSLTTPSGTISYTANKTIKYSFNTIGITTDNEFEIFTGSKTNVVALDGNTYETEVLENIYIKPCSEIYQVVDGVYKITSSKLAFPVEINFGDGECDNTATVTTKISVTYGNQTYERDYSYPITLQ